LLPVASAPPQEEEAVISIAEGSIVEAPVKPVLTDRPLELQSFVVPKWKLEGDCGLLQRYRDDDGVLRHSFGDLYDGKVAAATDDYEHLQSDHITGFLVILKPSEHTCRTGAARSLPLGHRRSPCDGASRKDDGELAATVREEG
jgi:hypothetical protein